MIHSSRRLIHSRVEAVKQALPVVVGETFSRGPKEKLGARLLCMLYRPGRVIVAWEMELGSSGGGLN